MNYTDDSVSLESTYDSWAKLISLAREKIEIASFYWTLRREDVYPDDSAKQVLVCNRSMAFTHTARLVAIADLFSSDPKEINFSMTVSGRGDSSFASRSG